MSDVSDNGAADKPIKPKEVVVHLMFPLELKNRDGDVTERIESMTLGRLNGRDMRDIANASVKGPGEAMMVLICRSAKIPPTTFDRLDAEDVTELGVVAADFIGGVLPTGVT